MNESAGVRAYQSYPLAGTPVGHLHDHATRVLASGLLPRCPHPDEPAFWYLSTRMLTCAACADQAAAAAGTSGECQICGEPASAVAAWVTGGVPCIAGLCDRCHEGGLVPLAAN